MKATTENTRSFPKPIRFSLYVGAVVVLCFFNWVALQAQNSSKTLVKGLDAVLFEDIEAEIQVKDWMLVPEESYLTIVEPEIEIVPWMLTFSDDYFAANEPEVEVESWMLTFSNEILASQTETDISVEPWMVSTCLWECAYMLARK